MPAVRRSACLAGKVTAKELTARLRHPNNNACLHRKVAAPNLLPNFLAEFEASQVVIRGLEEMLVAEKRKARAAFNMMKRYGIDAYLEEEDEEPAAMNPAL